MIQLIHSGRARLNTTQQKGGLWDIRIGFIGSYKTLHKFPRNESAESIKSLYSLMHSFGVYISEISLSQC